MKKIQTFDKALTDTVEDWRGGFTELYIFGVNQPDGTIKQILSVVGVVCMEMKVPLRSIDLLRAGCEVSNILPILQSLQSYNFSATETLGLENDSSLEGK